MPGNACFLQYAGFLFPGKLKVANVLQPCSLHLLPLLFSCVRKHVSVHGHRASKRLSSTVPSTLCGGD